MDQIVSHPVIGREGGRKEGGRKGGREDYEAMINSKGKGDSQLVTVGWSHDTSCASGSW